MRTIFRFLPHVSALVLTTSSAQLSPVDPMPTSTTPSLLLSPPAQPSTVLPPVVSEQNADHNVWQTTALFTNHTGRVVTRKTSSYHQLGTAMNRLVNGQWQPSSAEIVVTENGAAATSSAHGVVFSPDPSANAAIRLTLPSGETLSSHVFCLSYADTATGSNYVIASIQSSPGLLLPGNTRILFTNALKGDCEADILYQTGLSGLEQNIILRNYVDPSNYHLREAGTVLQCWTEITGGPDPLVTRLPGRAATQNGLAATPDDVYLHFAGSMSIGSGSAFMIGDGITNTALAKVTKAWVTSGNRRFLVEQVPLAAIAAQIRSLPPATHSGTNSLGHAMLWLQSAPPGQPVKLAARDTAGNAVGSSALKESVKNPLLSIPQESTKNSAVPQKVATQSSRIARLADVSILKRPGFLIDYSILTSQTNLTLHSGETYFVNGTVNVAGTLVIEPGCCVRFSETNHATIIATNVVCLTEDYEPAVFSSQSDNSIGDLISANPGGPTYAAYIALDFSSAPGPISLSHLRFTYLSNAIAAPSLTLQDVQFLNCQRAIAAGNLSSQFRNILAYNIQTFLDTGGEGYIGKTISGENMTVHQCPTFLLDTNGAINLTNCLFVGVTNWQCASFVTNHSVSLNSSTGLFQPTGLGNYYLTNCDYLGTGTASVNSNLLSELRRKTTLPPTIYSNAWITGSVTLSPQVSRDTNNNPTIGFHYPALDYIFSGCPITNGSVSILAGTAIGSFPNINGYAFTIGHDSTLQCLGDPGNPVRIASVKTIQEQPVAVNGGSFNVSVFTWGAGSGAASQGFFRFTKWTTVGRALSHFYGYYYSPTQPMAFVGCEFSAGQYADYAVAVTVTNCLFHRVSVDLEEWDNPGFTISLYNNLFHGGDLTLGEYIQPWTFINNAFDRNTFGNYGGPNIFHHNAYIGTSDYLAGVTRPGDLILTNLDWVQGPLGSYYQQTNSPLFHAGDRTAGLAGLFDWTVTTNLIAGLQIPESNNIVSIGLHYVATDSAGNPLDSNSNGIPDFLDDHDTNANGLPDYWEIQFFGSLGVDPSGDPDHDGLSNLQEYLGDTIPTVANAPTILNPPLSQTVFARTNATLSVTPTGSILTNYTFQWRKSSQPISGATSTSITLTNVSFADSANYSVLISNITARITSPLARLTVWTPGTVVAWGHNDHGQTNVPPDLTNAVALAAGQLHSAALKSDGTVTAWAGDGFSETNVPVGLSGVAAISAGGYHNIALKNDGSIATWGFNEAGYGPIPDGLTNVVSVASGFYHQVVLKSDGSVVAWGDSTFGQTNVPAGLSNVVAIAAGYYHNTAVKSDGSVVTWGDPGYPSLAVPSNATNAVSVSAGYDNSGAILKDGTALVWGQNYYGELSVPVAATNLVVLTDTVESSLALRRDGTLSAWARNDYGQTDFPPWINDFGVCAIAISQYHGLALYQDADRNGLPDWWEITWFGAIGQDPNADPDGDGLTNLQEYLAGTNPLNQCTRGDGVIDQAFKVIITRPASNLNIP